MTVISVPFDHPVERHNGAPRGRESGLCGDIVEFHHVGSNEMPYPRSYVRVEADEDCATACQHCGKWADTANEFAPGPRVAIWLDPLQGEAFCIDCLTAPCCKSCGPIPPEQVEIR